MLSRLASALRSGHHLRRIGALVPTLVGRLEPPQGQGHGPTVVSTRDGRGHDVAGARVTQRPAASASVAPVVTTSSTSMHTRPATAWAHAGCTAMAPARLARRALPVEPGLVDDPPRQAQRRGDDETGFLLARP